MDLTGMGATVLNWFFKSEEVFMLQMVSPLILKLSLFLVTAVLLIWSCHLGRRSYIIRSPTIQLAVSCFATTSTSITPIMPKIILSLGRTSAAKATLHPISLEAKTMPPSRYRDPKSARHAALHHKSGFDSEN